MSPRKTVQKRLIAESLSRLCHPTAEDIYIDVSKSLPDVSRTTIYRNLNQMVEDNRIRPLQFDKGATRYEEICGDHAHFYCTNCGKVFDIPMPDVDLYPIKAQIDGYEVESMEIVISGKCSSCEDKN